MPPEHFTPYLLSQIRAYTQHMLKQDFLAGLTVAIVALPLSMALAIASGASPDKGLITAVIAGFLVSFLGGSKVQIGGPTGAFVVVVFGVIAQHGYDGLLLATLLAGLILIVAGYSRLGSMIKYIPHPVITGFTTGIALIIATSQVKDFLGLTPTHNPADFIEKWQSYFAAFTTTNLWAVAVGMGALTLILGLRWYAPKWPSYLLAIVLFSVAVAVLGLPVETVGLKFGTLPSGLPMPTWPEVSFSKVQAVLPSAFTIAFLAGVEALLSAVVADGMTGSRHRPNQELVGQGVANVASAFLGGVPATGALARTATNVRAGAQSPMAGVFHSVFILLFLLFGMQLIAFVPMAVLAAILFVVAWGMSEVHQFIRIFKLSWTGRVVLILTFLLTVLVDLTVAIAVGVTLASLLFMHEMSKAVEFGTQPKKKIKTPEAQETDADQRDDLPDGVEVFRIAGPLFFGVATDLLEQLKAMGQMPRVLIVRMRLVPYLDPTAEGVLEGLVQDCGRANTQLIFSGLQPQPMAILQRAGIKNGKNGVLFAPDFDTARQHAIDLATL